MNFYSLLRFLFVFFYLFAGANHFINPEIYFPLIPDYLAKHKEWLNILAGLAEVVVALLMLKKETIKLASFLTIAMLLAFIPSHIHFILKGNLQIAGFTITPLIAWIRLVVVHPMLLYWAWWLGKNYCK
ncbi:MAG: hypothetical protein ACOVMM_07700 [Chitinophagaceae bacterium]